MGGVAHLVGRRRYILLRGHVEKAGLLGDNFVLCCLVFGLVAEPPLQKLAEANQCNWDYHHPNQDENDCYQGEAEDLGLLLPATVSVPTLQKALFLL